MSISFVGIASLRINIYNFTIDFKTAPPRFFLPFGKTILRIYCIGGK